MDYLAPVKGGCWEQQCCLTVQLFQPLCFLSCYVFSPISTSVPVPQPVDPGAHHPTWKGCLSVPFSWKVLISFPISTPGCSFLSCLILPTLFPSLLLFSLLFLPSFPKSHPYFPLRNSFSLVSFGFLLLSLVLHPTYSSISPPCLSLPPLFYPS